MPIIKTHKSTLEPLEGAGPGGYVTLIYVLAGDGVTISMLLIRRLV